MPRNTGLVLATRNMHAYYAPYAPDIDLPPDTVAFDAGWGEPWVDVGYTDGGLAFTVSLDRDEIRVDQLFDPVLRPAASRDIHFDTNLAQLDPLILPVASGYGEVETAPPAAGTKGHDDFVIGDDVPGDVFYAFGFEAEQQDGEPFRAMIYKGIPTGSPNPSFGQSDTKATYELIISAVPGAAGAAHPLARFRRVIAAL